MSLITNLNRVMQEQRLTLARVMDELRELGYEMDEDHLRAIRNGTFVSIRRKEIVGLMQLCHKYGHHFFDRPRVYPVWASYGEGSSTVVFTGSDADGEPMADDAEVAKDLREFLKARGCRYRAQVSEQNPSAVIDRMKTHNCIFVGSPRWNPATEIALASIYGAKPFDAGVENREAVGVRFRGPGWNPIASSSAAVEAWHAGDPIGIWVRHEDEDADSDGAWLSVSYAPKNNYLRASGVGLDVGVAIVIARPFGTDHDVTSVLACGFTALSTIELVRELIREIADFGHFLLPSGRPSSRVLAVPYFKYPNADHRTPKIMTRWFTPSGAVAEWRKLRQQFDQWPKAAWRDK